jgi:hypothetical protein
VERLRGGRRSKLVVQLLLGIREGRLRVVSDVRRGRSESLRRAKRCKSGRRDRRRLSERRMLLQWRGARGVTRLDDQEFKVEV